MSKKLLKISCPRNPPEVAIQGASGRVKLAVRLDLASFYLFQSECAHPQTQVRIGLKPQPSELETKTWFLPWFELDSSNLVMVILHFDFKLHSLNFVYEYVWEDLPSLN